MLSGKSMTPGPADARWSAVRSLLGPALICVLAVAVEVYTLAFWSTTHVEANGARHVLVKEFAAQVPITQSFDMRSDGLTGVRIRLATTERSDITLDWVLFEQEPSAFVPLYRKRQHVRSGAGESWVVMPFPVVARSIGRTYKLEVRAIDVHPLDGAPSPGPASSGPALVASSDDALPTGVLVIGIREQSGDLVFDTLALGDTILGRFRLTTASTSEGANQRLWIAAVAIVLQNILLAAFVIHFWPRRPHR
jgi:hypothetical protein